MVGGKDFSKSQFNRTILALRSPGSTFKLFPYAAAIDRGMKPETKVFDAQRCWNGYCPKNFGNRFRVDSQTHFSLRCGFVGEVADGDLVLDLEHELLPSPCRLAAGALGGAVVVVSEPDARCELRNRSDEPEITGVL